MIEAIQLESQPLESRKANEVYSGKDTADPQPRRAGDEPRRYRRGHRCDHRDAASHLLQIRDQPATTYFWRHWLVAATTRRAITRVPHRPNPAYSRKVLSPIPQRNLAQP